LATVSAMCSIFLWKVGGGIVIYPFKNYSFNNDDDVIMKEYSLSSGYYLI
jgi:hypothetical protein